MMSSVTQPPPRLVQPVSIEVMEGKVCVETPIDVSHRLRQSSLFSDYRFREETIEDDEEMFPEPSLRPTIPLWFMPLVAANVFTIVVAGIERSYVKRSWSRRNFAFLHSKPYRLFYREVEMYKQGRRKIAWICGTWPVLCRTSQVSSSLGCSVPITTEGSSATREGVRKGC